MHELLVAALWVFFIFAGYWMIRAGVESMVEVWADRPAHPGTCPPPVPRMPRRADGLRPAGRTELEGSGPSEHMKQQTVRGSRRAGMQVKVANEGGEDHGYQSQDRVRNPH